MALMAGALQRWRGRTVPPGQRHPKGKQGICALKEETVTTPKGQSAGMGGFDGFKIDQLSGDAFLRLLGRHLHLSFLQNRLQIQAIDMARQEGSCIDCLRHMISKGRTIEIIPAQQMTRILRPSAQGPGRHIQQMTRIMGAISQAPAKVSRTVNQNNAEWSFGNAQQLACHHGAAESISHNRHNR